MKNKSKRRKKGSQILLKLVFLSEDFKSQLAYSMPWPQNCIGIKETVGLSRLVKCNVSTDK